ncbi:hypothetical protein A2529_05050 [Candidatus Peribacteria bacterium RIFOXYD2_FULL_58_15]|nr:MAG: hypothetical protein A2529_05050 [Candidatus Peribacteria bacterium RIFOXYD2_FULL_58_15]
MYKIILKNQNNCMFQKSSGKGGRPTVMTSEVTAKLIEAFKLDVTIEEACTYAGISTDSYHRKVNNDEVFCGEMERARQFASWKARRSVIEGMEHDPHLALKYLERKRKAEFSPRSEIDVEGLSLTDLIRRAEENRKPVDWQDIGGYGVPQGAIPAEG